MPPFTRAAVYLLIFLIGTQTLALDSRIYDADKQDDLKQLREWKAQIEQVQTEISNSSFWGKVVNQKFAVRLAFPENWLAPLGKDPAVQYPSSYLFAKDNSPLLNAIEKITELGIATQKCVFETCYLTVNKSNFAAAQRFLAEQITQADKFNYCVVQDVYAFGFEGSVCTNLPTVMVRGYRVVHSCVIPVEVINSIPQRYSSCYYSNRIYTNKCAFSVGAGARYKKKDGSGERTFIDREEAFQAMLADPTCH
jgi:hypothetical protein